MSVEIITKEDLQILRIGIADDIRRLLNEAANKGKKPVEGYKTKHVRKVLGCCQNKLVSLRIAGKLRIKKIGGTIYYNPKDVERLVNDGY